jgi:hypothetical protein
LDALFGGRQNVRPSYVLQPGSDVRTTGESEIITDEDDGETADEDYVEALGINEVQEEKVDERYEVKLEFDRGVK